MKILILNLLLLACSYSYSFGKETEGEWTESKPDDFKELDSRMSQEMEKLKQKKNSAARRIINRRKQEEARKEKGPTQAECEDAIFSYHSRSKDKELTQLMTKVGFPRYQEVLKERCRKDNYYGINKLKEFKKLKKSRQRRRSNPVYR